jgi:hypothetical protein
MRIVVLSIPAWCLLVECVSAAPLTYDLRRLTLVTSSAPPNVEEHVVTGTITTNGTIGRLKSTDFVDWSISVEGPRPYRFHPGNAGANVLTGWVDASPTEITTQGQFGDLFIRAYDNTVSNCTNCQQSLHWSGWGFGYLDYQYYDSDFVPTYNPSYTVVDEMPFVIASRVVPEPSCRLATILAMATLGTWRKRKGFRAAH